MVRVTDPESGEILFTKPRGDRRNAKAKPEMSYEGMIFTTCGEAELERSSMLVSPRK
jgi:hypothetical protein